GRPGSTPNRSSRSRRVYCPGKAAFPAVRVPGDSSGWAGGLSPAAAMAWTGSWTFFLNERRGNHFPMEGACLVFSQAGAACESPGHRPGRLEFRRHGSLLPFPIRPLDESKKSGNTQTETERHRLERRWLILRPKIGPAECRKGQRLPFPKRGQWFKKSPPKKMPEVIRIHGWERKIMATFLGTVMARCRAMRFQKPQPHQM